MPSIDLRKIGKEDPIIIYLDEGPPVEIKDLDPEIIIKQQVESQEILSMTPEELAKDGGAIRRLQAHTAELINVPLERIKKLGYRALVTLNQNLITVVQEAHATEKKQESESIKKS